MVASFTNQIQSEYYVGNRSVTIEDILLGIFSAKTHPETILAPESRTNHDVLYSFLYDKNKQDAATTASHIKTIIRLLNQ